MTGINIRIATISVKVVVLQMLRFGRNSIFLLTFKIADDTILNITHGGVV